MAVDFLKGASDRLGQMMNGEPLTLNSASDQPTEDIELCAWVRTKLEERRSNASRAANEATWITNIAYLCGIDSVEFDAQTRQFRAVNSLPKAINKSRVHVNKVLPTIQNKLAKLCKSQPRWDVRPKSSDDQDKESARLGKSVILQDWDYCKIAQKRQNLFLWAMECGHAYLKVSWDTSLGPKELKPTGDESRPVEMITMGDKRVDICSPFQCFPDPLARDWDEVQDFIEAKIRPLSYFIDQYPERGSLVKQEECWLNSLSYEMRINSFNSTGSDSGSSLALPNTAIEISYYEKPSKKHPGGRHIITSNGVKLKDGVLPIDEIPFVKFDDIKVGGKFNSESTITHIRPMQDQYNRNKSLKAAFLNRTLMGKYISARGHGLAAEAFNDQSGEVLEYDPLPSGDKPEVLQTPNMPQYVFQEDDSLINDINDVSGINQVSRGQLPSSSIPAIGMQMLVEQDDTRIGVQTENHEYSYADLGRMLLKFTAKYYTDDRLLKEAGKNFDYIVKNFKGEDLRDNFDVHVIRGSTIPGSKVLERENIVNLHQGGYFGNPQDPKVLENVLSMLEFGDEFEPWKKHSLVMASIQKGIDMIESKTIKPPVSEFDNHTLWIQELDDYRLSDRFERLSDIQKSLVLEVMNDHVNELQKMVAPQTMEDPGQDPELVETDAAQKMVSESGSTDTPPPDAIQNESIPAPPQEQM